MKMKSLIAILVLVTLAMGIAGCKTNVKSKTTGLSPPKVATPPPISTSDDLRAQSTPQDSSSAEKAEERPNYTADPEPPPPASAKGLTHEVMKNVNFHADDLVVYDIRTIRGTVLRRHKDKPPTFDDKRSFILKIDSAVVGARMDTLANLMNSYVFAYSGAPLKNIHFSIDGNQLKATGRVHKIADLPFEIKGNLSATADGKIRVHPTSIKTAGLPVKGFMHLFGLEVDDIIKATHARGLKFDDNDLILDPEQIGPPPMIRGKVTAVQIVGDEVVLVFGGANNLSEAEVTRLANSRSGGNYVYYRGGTLRWGKVTMTNSDLKIIDANPKDPFDFSIDHYNQQLVAGYGKGTPGYGLVAYAPDYYKIQKNSPIANSERTNARTSSASRESKVRTRDKSQTSVVARAPGTRLPREPKKEETKKKGFLARLLHVNRK